MTAWLVVLAIGVGTFMIRISFIATLGRYTVPEWVPRALRFVAPSVLAALTLPAIVLIEDRLAIGLDNHRLIAATLAALVAFWTKNAFATIGVGLVALWILEAVF